MEVKKYLSSVVVSAVTGSKRLLVILLLLLFEVAVQYGEAYKLPDSMVGQRNIVEGFGLGPAPFPDFKDMHFELFGDAFLRDDSVKVTDAVQHQKGAIWSKKKYSLKPVISLGVSNPDSSKINEKNIINNPIDGSMQIDLAFRVGGVPGHMYGDGFALWYVDKESRGRGGNALGGPNKWNGLGIFFDTYDNRNFKGKKYPYVYGVVNNQKLSYDYDKLTNKEVENQGCYVPMRGTDDMLEVTNARVTYFKKTVSVLLQPYGAEDWLQCFQIKNVDLPEEGFFGVTAMTGEVVDKHQMIAIQIYNGIKVDPFNAAVVYEKSQMPALWEDMRQSGNVAREFERWEKDIEEDVEDFRLQTGGNADYYQQYSADAYDAPDNYFVPQAEDYYHGEEGNKFEKPSYLNNYRTDKAAKRGKGDTKGVTLTAEEAKKIDEMISGTAIAKEIKELNEARRKRTRKLRMHMEAEFEQALDQVNDLVKALRKKEYELSRRIDRLGSRLHIKLKQAFKNQENQGSGWFSPFMGILIFVLGGTALGYYQYRQHMKTHLL